MLKTIFFGTPEVAVPFLEELNELTQVALVVTQPDRPRGRKLEITPCPVKARALELGLNVISPENLNDAEARIKEIGADVAFAVAYGKLFKENIISAPRLGIINIHFSLLPSLRGAAPVQYALINGLGKTGVSAFWIDEGLDTGPLFLQKETAVLPSDDALTLFPKLIGLGVETMAEVIKNIERGNIIKTPQAGEPSYAKLINKEDAVIDFENMTAAQIHNLVRGLAAGPQARFMRDGAPVLVLQTALPPCPPNGLMVKCKDGEIVLLKVRPAGKKDMDGAAFANGYKLK